MAENLAQYRLGELIADKADLAAAESRGRTAGYAEAVANTQDDALYQRWADVNAVAPAGARSHVPSIHRDVIHDFLEWAAPSATTEGPTP